MTRLVSPDALCDVALSTEEPHPILYDSLNGQLIRTAALKTDGAPGPSGLDTHCWRHLCTSFHSASDELCGVVAATTRKLCSQYVDPASISALVACRLIPIDK